VVKGEELLKNQSASLFLPNHQALIDPMIIYSQLYKYSKISPVVTERFYNAPALHRFFKSIKAVPVSDLSAGNRDTSVLQNITKHVEIAMGSGRGVLLYPSGQLCGQGFEKIINKQSAFQIVGRLPEETKVIGVRITGLWGSMWSKAWMGSSPNFPTTLLKAVFFTFVNLFVFLPKRKIQLEFIDISAQAKSLSKDKVSVFNGFLEDFYNSNGEESVHYLKHAFFMPQSNRMIPTKIEGSVADLKTSDVVDSGTISQAIFTEIKQILKETGEVAEQNITLEQNLSLDLGIDSITMVDIITNIENTYKVAANVELTSIKTVADLCILAMGNATTTEKLPEALLTQTLYATSTLEVDENMNIVSLFLKNFKAKKKETFAFDKLMGTCNRKEFLLKAMVVSEIIKKEVKDTHVGIMLPALQSTTLLVMASYLAGKVPVMLNWTVGKKVLNHCIDSVGLNHILTAKSFYDKIEEQLPIEAKNKCIFFEKKVAQMSLSTKLKGLLKYYITPKYAIKPQDTAVILFTSGSESLPKAVALSHENIVHNLHGVLRNVSLDSNNIFLGFLPPFHSFGFTVLTILPLVSGIKVAYTPDPTDSKEIVRILKHTGANTLLATPTFLRMIMAVSDKDALKNVSLAITGAESLHPSLISDFHKKANDKAVLLEGYGITECSPVLSINPREKQKNKSVGCFIHGVDYVIADLQSGQAKAHNEEGMILVKGKSIFKGYLDTNINSPFVTVNGEEYYKTGDLGYIDEEGYVFITGRLKRFIKIAGEMISLPAIENALQEKFGSSEEVKFAVEGNDTLNPPQIVLFSKDNTDINEVNIHLRNQGFSSLVKINRIVMLNQIPVLGTGKTDYKVLKEMVK